MKLITGNTSSTPGGQFRKQHTHSQQEWVQQKYRRSRKRWLTYLNETSTVTKRKMIFIHLSKQTKCSYFNMLFILPSRSFSIPYTAPWPLQLAPYWHACRRLFVDGDSTSEPPQPVKVAQPSLVSSIQAGQTVVTMATATVTANNGQTVTIPVQGAKLSIKSSVPL